LFLLESIDLRDILECAKAHQVCPFELSLDVSLYCEIIICDYNYAFDPRVHLERFFGEEPTTHLLLVDEAHNLPARSREMFSASLDSVQLAAAVALIKGQSPQLDRSLEKLQGYFGLLKSEIANKQPGIDQVEMAIKVSSVMSADFFRACRELPDHLLDLLARFTFQCRQYLDQTRNQPNPRALLDLYFSALFFLRIAEEYHDDTYVTVARLEEGKLELVLMCLDASEKLAAAYVNRHAAVFFSATLSPLAYYTGLLHGHHPAAEPESLCLGSPFPPENLLVLTCTRLSTRYKMRRDTIVPILEMILQAVRQKTGNYLVFVPSFAYLEMLRSLLRGRPEVASLDLMFQAAAMNEPSRRKFLHRFEQFGEKTLLAVAVIGGIFAEGIDLAGERLAGVVVVGAGLPQICPEREIMRQYYAEALGSGYEYAYLYPGFNKVQQAAGRVIRSENDRGFVLLIDDRYETQVYSELFPAEWQPRQVGTPEELGVMLQEFWN
jgi:DNA excision repair protein ERCC-2